MVGPGSNYVCFKGRIRIRFLWPETAPINVKGRIRIRVLLSEPDPIMFVKDGFGYGSNGRSTIQFCLFKRTDLDQGLMVGAVSNYLLNDEFGFGCYGRSGILFFLKAGFGSGF